eukprot:8049036-Pyramimonas_sp.AAC.1
MDFATMDMRWQWQRGPWSVVVKGCRMDVKGYLFVHAEEEQVCVGVVDLLHLLRAQPPPPQS